MILTELRVWNWRGLPELALEGLCPGLNLVLGPNESGKTRLVEALWFGLFESSKGKAEHKRVLQGWATSEAPRVEVGFRVREQAYRVAKQFLSSSATILEGGGRTWKGEEAEERLAELLGTIPAGRRAEAADLGVWPLLWVRQFESNLPAHAHLNEATRGLLHDLLAEEVGQIAVGPAGLALLERARAEAGRYWTPTGRPTGELKAAQDTFEVVERTLGEARRRKAELHAAASQLARAGRELEALRERLKGRRAAWETARARAEEAGRVASDLKAQEAEVRMARQAADAAAAELRLRRERDDALRDRGAEIAGARSRAAELRAREETAARVLSEEEQALRGASEAHRKAKDSFRRAADQERRRDTARQLAELEERLGEVRSATKRLKELAGAVGAVRVDRGAVEALRSAHGEWEKVRARLEGASARLEVFAARDLDLSGQTLAAGGTRVWLCAEPTSVEIVSVATVTVSPGGAGLSRLREEEGLRRRQVEELFAEAGVATLAEAEDRWEARQELERRALQLTGFLEARCPEGFPALEARGEELRRALDGLGPDDAAAPGTGEARAAADGASEAEGAARARREACLAVLAGLRVDLAREEQRAQALGEEQGRLSGLLAEMPSLTLLEKGSEAAQAAWQEALATREGLRRRYEGLGGDGAADDRRREEAACQALEAQRRDLEHVREQLVGRLRALEGEALHEQEQEAETAWTQAKQCLAATTRWAEAARRLSEALDAARRRAQERLTAPVRARVEPYLRQVFPGSGLGLSESWEVRGLNTGNLEEPFAELSGGAREQLGVIVRVGLGELLAGDERLPLVLDDALPNTDFERVGRLHRVLYQAAKRLQILVFSCHPEAFDGLGAERTFRLAPRGRG